VATKKPTPQVRIKVQAHDGSAMEGTLTRARAIPLIYYTMSPEERVKVRGALTECDDRIAEDATKKKAEAANG